MECHVCGAPFLKNKNDVQWGLKRGHRFCCSLSCRGKSGSKGSRADAFDYLVRQARKRAKTKGLLCDVTSVELRKLYKDQSGKCAISGVELDVDVKYSRSRKKSTNLMSLDRIDSSIGYTKSNVQLVCLAINYMKNTFTQEEVLSFLEDAYKNSGG